MWDRFDKGMAFATFPASGRSKSLRLGLGGGTIYLSRVVMLLAAALPRGAFKSPRLPLRCRGLFLFWG